jgi:PDZ domain-containing protein
MRLLAPGLATLLFGLAAALAAQDPTIPSSAIRKGEVAAADARAGTLTLRGEPAPVILRVAGGARAQLGSLRAGDYVEVRIDTATGQVVRFISIRKGTGPGTGDRRESTRPANLTVMANAACRLLVNAREVGATRPAPGSERDHKAELALPAGSYILKAVTADGREWEGEVKPGAEMQTVRIAFPPPPASADEFDAAAAQAWLALRDARTMGRAVDAVLDGSFAYYDFDISLVFSAQEGLKRALAGLPSPVAGDAARAQAAAELKAAAAQGDGYLATLAEAVDTAVKESRSGKGSAARSVRAKARALESRLVPDPARMAPVMGTAAFRQALPPDRQAEAGGPRHPADLDLDADYCSCRPAVLAVVDKDGLADRQLKLKVGDVLVSANGKPLASVWDLKLALQAAAGGKLKLAIEREGKSRQLDITAPRP